MPSCRFSISIFLPSYTLTTFNFSFKVDPLLWCTAQTKGIDLSNSKLAIMLLPKTKILLSSRNCFFWMDLTFSKSSVCVLNSTVIPGGSWIPVSRILAGSLCSIEPPLSTFSDHLMITYLIKNLVYPRLFAIHHKFCLIPTLRGSCMIVCHHFFQMTKINNRNCVTEAIRRIQFLNFNILQKSK